MKFLKDNDAWGVMEHTTEDGQPMKSYASIGLLKRIFINAKLDGGTSGVAHIRKVDSLVWHVFAPTIEECHADLREQAAELAI